MFKFLLLTLAISNQELDLKNEIFDGYSKYVRPVEFEKEITDVEIGLAAKILKILIK